MSFSTSFCLLASKWSMFVHTVEENGIMILIFGNLLLEKWMHVNANNKDTVSICFCSNCKQCEMYICEVSASGQITAILVFEKLNILGQFMCFVEHSAIQWMAREGCCCSWLSENAIWLGGGSLLTVLEAVWEAELKGIEAQGSAARLTGVLIVPANWKKMYSAVERVRTIPSLQGKKNKIRTLPTMWYFIYNFKQILSNPKVLFFGHCTNVVFCKHAVKHACDYHSVSTTVLACST